MGIELSSSTIRKARQKQGWTRLELDNTGKGSTRLDKAGNGWTRLDKAVKASTRPEKVGEDHCQLLKNANKPKRLDFATRILEENDDFDNVIFTDELTVTAEFEYCRFGFRSSGEAKQRKPKAVSFTVWAGISKHGATDICIFEGPMDGDTYCRVLELSLLPFVRNKLPTHRFVQGNHPRHTSNMAQELFE